MAAALSKRTSMIYWTVFETGTIQATYLRRVLNEKLRMPEIEQNFKLLSTFIFGSALCEWYQMIRARSVGTLYFLMVTDSSTYTRLSANCSHSMWHGAASNIALPLFSHDVSCVVRNYSFSNSFVFTVATKDIYK